MTITKLIKRVLRFGIVDKRNQSEIAAIRLELETMKTVIGELLLERKELEEEFKTMKDYIYKDFTKQANEILSGLDERLFYLENVKNTGKITQH